MKAKNYKLTKKCILVKNDCVQLQDDVIRPVCQKGQRPYNSPVFPLLLQPKHTCYMYTTLET